MATQVSKVFIDRGFRVAMVYTRGIPSVNRRRCVCVGAVVVVAILVLFNVWQGDVNVQWKVGVIT